jgi:hypothetical protein
MFRHRFGTSAEHRQEQAQRVLDSPSLATKFAGLKSLTVDLIHVHPDTKTQSSPVKYEVNLSGAKSVFRFNCPNQECVRGDFDLTDELAKAITGHRASATGELVCRGWRSKTAIDRVPCGNILRYTFRLKY